MLIYLNGKLVPKEEANVSVFDHGVLYGDGIFEGIRVYEGNIFRLKEHIERLYESAKTIWLEVPMTPEEMADFCMALADRAKQGIACMDYYVGGMIDAPDPESGQVAVHGAVFCVSPLAEINGDSSISIAELRFSGMLDWGGS